jgi:hypothetical protein
MYQESRKGGEATVDKPVKMEISIELDAENYGGEQTYVVVTREADRMWTFRLTDRHEKGYALDSIYEEDITRVLDVLTWFQSIFTEEVDEKLYGDIQN